jgi:hypothetical protein
MKARFTPATDVDWMLSKNPPSWVIDSEALWLVYPDHTNEAATEESIEDGFHQVIGKFSDEYGNRGTVVDFNIENDGVSPQALTWLIKGRYAYESL